MTNPTLPSSLFFKVIFSCLASILILGCAATQPPAPPKPVFFEHKIKFSGETLAAIAGWYTGDAKNWHAIAAANPKLKPNNLQIGDAVEIPENLITQVEELPKKLPKRLMNQKNPPKVKTRKNQKILTLPRNRRVIQTPPSAIKKKRSYLAMQTTPLIKVRLLRLPQQ